MKYFALFVGVSLILTGCSVHKNLVEENPVTLPDVFVEYDGAAGLGESPGKYWQSFNDENLNRIIEDTLANNLDITKAVARLNQVEAAGRVNAAARLPYLNLTGSAGRAKQFSSMGNYTYDTHSLSLAAGYELDLWQKIKNTTDAASFRALASRQDLRALYLSITAQAADLYYLMVEQRAQLVLTDEIINSYQDTLERMETRYREGLVPSLDVYQAQQNILAAKVRRPVFAKNLAIATHAIAVLAGRFPDKTSRNGLADLPSVASQIPVGLPAHLLTRRPDVMAAFLRLKASDADIAAAIAERFPSFNILATVSDPGRSGSELLWSMLLDAVQPLFDGGRRRAGVDIKRAEFDQELASYKQVLLRAVQEVEDALASSRATGQRLELLKKRQVATEATLRLSQDRYFQGLSDYLPVLTAQVIDFDVQSQILAAEKALISDQFSLMRAVGGNWMDAAIKDKINAGK